MQNSPRTSVPEPTKEDALKTACELYGVQTEYWDIFGTHHVATPEVLEAVLTSMGVRADSPEELNASLEARLRDRTNPRTIVANLSDGWIPVTTATGTFTFVWENGERATVTASNLEPAGDGRYKLPLPAEAPLGYHQMGDARLILCPDRAWKPDFLDRGHKGAGVAISLYGLRSERNWGCGDFTDLRIFTAWAVERLGVAFVALNPLHSIPNRQPYNTSPYLPNCSFYRNPLYLDVERIPTSPIARLILASAQVQDRLARLREAKYVEYEKVWTLKQRFLKFAFREFLRAGDTAVFDAWAAGEGYLLDRYAVYSALDEILHKRDRNVWIWPDWPEEYRDPDSPEVAQFAIAHSRLVKFYKWIQWQVDLQLEDAQAYAQSLGMPIGLYHDLALATDRCGSDLWAHRPFYVDGCRVGSPPDDFNPKGQDWAFPPPNSARHHDDGYRLFAESIRRNCRRGGALRIDHVMRFFRLFWIPDGVEAKDGVYVRDHADDLVRILALESVRNRVLVIGEDLGTVEPYIREALAKAGILSYRLLIFERNGDGSFKRPEAYPRQALVSISTHDLPTLAGFWTGRDIEARRAAGVLRDDADYQEQWRSRTGDKQKLLDVIHSMRLLPDWFPRRAEDLPEFTGELHNAAVGFLASTPSELLALSGEDLFKGMDQQNLPGTTAEYPNWRGKMEFALEELSTEKQALNCALMFRKWMERTDRA